MLIYKNISLFTVLMFFVFMSCSAHDQVSEEDDAMSSDLFNNIGMDSNTTLTQLQETALEALNTLQVNTEERNRLYSTFAGIDHPCYPPDTSLTISQSEFLKAMQEFVTKECTNLTKEERNALAAESVLAQEQYQVLLCLGYGTNLSFKSGIPLSGTWVLPNVLGRRDVVIVW